MQVIRVVDERMRESIKDKLREEFKQFKIVLLITLAFLLLAQVVHGLPSYTIEGDRVYINDSKVFLSAKPAYLDGSGWVTYVLTTYNYNGSIYFATGWDKETSKPSKAQYSNPRNVTARVNYTCYYTFNYSLSPKHFWCYNVTGVVFEHDFEAGNNVTKTASWNETYQDDWSDMNLNGQKISYDYDGKDTWWYTDSTYDVAPNQSKMIRIWVDVPNIPITARYTPAPVKYDFAVWPAMYGRNISKAIQNNHLYLLDPWVKPTANIAFYYSFDNGNLIDLTGKYNGTNASGVSYTSGTILNGTLNSTFNGVVSSVGAWKNLSINMWLKPHTLADGRGFVSKRTSSTIDFDSFENNATGRVYTRVYSSSSDLIQSYCDVLRANEWSMLTIVWIGGTADNTIKTYKNGTLITNCVNGSAGTFSGTLRNSASNLNMLQELGASAYAGVADEIMIANDVWNSSDVAYLYNSGSPGTEQQWPFTPLNNPPNVTTPLLAPSTIYLNTNIIANTTYTDPEANNGTLYWTLFINGVANQTKTNTSVLNGTIFNTTFSTGGYVHYDNITVQVGADDGTVNGTFLNSTAYMIKNTLPTLSNLLTLNGTINNNTAITANVTYSDADNDTATITWSWYKNGAFLINTTNTSIPNGTVVRTSLNPSNYSQGDNITVSVIANDRNDSNILNSTVTHIRFWSVIDSVAFNLTPYYVTSSIVAECGAHNDDGLTIYYYFDFFVNTIFNITVQGNSGGLSNYTLSNVYAWPHFSNLTVQCRAIDNYDNSTPVNSTVQQVLNSLPSISSPTISPAIGYKTTDHLTCTNGSYSDADGDPLYNWTYSWYKNGVLNQTGTNNNFSNASFVHFDNITCGIIASDGFNYSLQVNSSVLTISNTPAVTNGSRLSPLTVYRDTAFLMGYCQGTDYDNDSLYYYSYWLVNGSAEGPATVLVTDNTSASGVERNVYNKNNNTVYGNFFVKGNTYTLMCAANESNATSPLTYGGPYLASNNVTIQNSPPIMRTVRLYSTTNVSDKVVQSYCNASDVDADTVKYSYYYWKNGVVYTSITATGLVASNTERNVENSSFSYGNYTLSCMANDTQNASAWMNSTVIEILGFFNVSNSSNATVYEATYTSFYLNVSNDESDVNTTFVYNNTVFATTRTIDVNTYVFNITIPVPLVDVNATNISYSWQYNYSRTSVSHADNITGNQTVLQAYQPVTFAADHTQYIETQPVAYTRTYTAVSGSAATLAYIRSLDNVNSSSATANSSITQGLNTNSSENHTLQSWLNLSWNGANSIRPYAQVINYTTYLVNITVCANQTMSNNVSYVFQFFDGTTLTDPVNVSIGSGVLLQTYYGSSSTKRTTSIGMVGINTDYLCYNIPRFSYPYNISTDYTVTAYATGYNPTSAVESNDYFTVWTSGFAIDPIIYSLYMASATNFSTVHIHLVTLDDVPYLPGQTIIYQYQYNPTNASYSFVASSYTDFTGTVPFSVEVTKYYKFNVTYLNGTLVPILNDPTYFKVTQSDYYYRVTVLMNTEQLFVNSIYSWNRTLTFSNVTGVCNFSYQPLPESQGYCLRVINTTMLHTDELYYACNSTAPGSITYTVDLYNGSSYSCEAIIISPFGNRYSTDTKYVKIRGSTFDLAQYLGLDGLVLAFFIVGIMAAIGLWKPSVSIFLGGASFILVCALGLIGIPTAAAFGAVGVITVIGITLVKN